jgi:hypothetical protein
MKIFLKAMTMLLCITLATTAFGQNNLVVKEINSVCLELQQTLVANKVSACKYSGLWITYPGGMGELYNDELGHSFSFAYEELSDTSVSIITSYCTIGGGSHDLFVEDEESLETAKFLLRVARGEKVTGEKCPWDPHAATERDGDVIILIIEVPKQTMPDDEKYQVIDASPDEPTDHLVYVQAGPTDTIPSPAYTLWQELADQAEEAPHAEIGGSSYLLFMVADPATKATELWGVSKAGEFISFSKIAVNEYVSMIAPQRDPVIFEKTGTGYGNRRLNGKLLDNLAGYKRK